MKEEPSKKKASFSSRDKGRANKGQAHGRRRRKEGKLLCAAQKGIRERKPCADAALDRQQEKPAGHPWGRGCIGYPEAGNTDEAAKAAGKKWHRHGSKWEIVRCKNRT